LADEYLFIDSQHVEFCHKYKVPPFCMNRYKRSFKVHIYYQTMN